MLNSLVVLAALQAPVPVATTDTMLPVWTPHRVYHADKKQWRDLEGLAAEIARHDVAFLGEQHDDKVTHWTQRAILEAVGRRRGDVILSLEMFERDVQPHLDAYLAGTMTEEAFLKVARPWPNYAADYRPLVEYAKARGWRVIAANVPRKMASGVAMRGLNTVTGLTDSTRAWAAADFTCPKDDYFERFSEVIPQHPQGNGPAPTQAELDAITLSFYHAQCVKDETMAESIVRARAAAGGTPLVIHVNGAFHSDYGDGTAERVRRRIPNARTLVVSAIPAKDLDAVTPSKDDRKKGDWLVYALRP